MKRILVACALVIGLLALGTTNATATYCVQIAPYCDRLEVNFDRYGNTYGYWDYKCACAPLASMLGNSKPGEIILAGLLAEYNVTESWRIHPSLSTVDIWRYDGVNPPSLLLGGTPFTLSPGSCGCADASDKPSINGSAK